MRNFEKIREMSVEDLALAMGCPADIDDNFECPFGCEVEHPDETSPISCYSCIKKGLETEATR